MPELRPAVERETRARLDVAAADAFLTRLHKVFARDEMKEDLVLGPARLGQSEDASEYTERLRFLMAP